MIYFTSDLHLGHANIIRHCNRPFSSVREMDETLIKNWNIRVRPDDTVYVLGDVIFRSAKAPEEYLSRLSGKKHLILGNHDQDWVKKCTLEYFFESVSTLDHISDGTHQMTLCHAPMTSWPDNTRSYMVFGHIHNNTNDACWQLICRSELMLNAGVDINNFMPVTFEEMAENNKRHKENYLQHLTIDERRSVLNGAPL